MAISATWVVAGTAVTTTAGTVYTTAASTAATYSYARDLVVNNGGTATIFVGLGASNVATSVASFQVPAGGSLILSQCQVPQGVPLTALTGAGSSVLSIGYCSVFSAI